jgi:inorganic triphosphatase YgiF
MSLFRRSLQTEPEPAPEQQPDALVLAITEEAAAAKVVQETSELCVQLDHEQKSWAQRRDIANRVFVAALQRHASAKAELARLLKPAPIAVGAVVGGEN